jgi:hypothetical protein
MHSSVKAHTSGKLAVNPSAWMPWNYLEQTQTGHIH